VPGTPPLEPADQGVDLGDEARGAGHPDRRDERQDGEEREAGHDLDQRAIVREVARVGALVQEADQQEQGARDETVRDHLHHRAGQARLVQGGEAEQDHAHVGH
jgi:hypothetical protein